MRNDVVGIIKNFSHTLVILLTSLLDLVCVQLQICNMLYCGASNHTACLCQYPIKHKVTDMVCHTEPSSDTDHSESSIVLVPHSIINTKVKILRYVRSFTCHLFHWCATIKRE